MEKTLNYPIKKKVWVEPTFKRMTYQFMKKKRLTISALIDISVEEFFETHTDALTFTPLDSTLYGVPMAEKKTASIDFRLSPACNEKILQGTADFHEKISFIVYQSILHYIIKHDK